MKLFAEASIKGILYYGILDYTNGEYKLDIVIAADCSVSYSEYVI